MSILGELSDIDTELGLNNLERIPDDGFFDDEEVTELAGKA